MSTQRPPRKTRSQRDLDQRLRDATQRLDKVLHDATQRLIDMQRSERQHGFASPENIGPYSLIRTARLALHAGLICQHWDSVAEAYVMLEHAMVLLGTEIFKAEEEAYRNRGTPASSPASDPTHITH